MSYADNVSLTEIPNYQQKHKVTFEKVRNNFGDGYTANIAVGLNNAMRTYDISFSRSITLCDSIEALILSTKKVGKIIWTPSSGIAGKWLYSDIKRSIDDAGTHTVSFTLHEIFES